MFQEGQIIGQHQAMKTAKEIAEITRSGCGTIQQFMKTWKDCGELAKEWLRAHEESFSHLI